jgi:excinuclease ABC subunit C
MAIVGIAKKLEEIYFPGDSFPLYIDKRSESLKVVQFLRNEAHRFGITHHRNKRSKNAIHSELTDIKGIGVATFNRLMKHFKTVKRLKEAPMNEIEKIVGTSKAQIILSALKK